MISYHETCFGMTAERVIAEMRAAGVWASCFADGLEACHIKGDRHDAEMLRTWLTFGFARLEWIGDK
jgi:hypothetical protein